MEHRLFGIVLLSGSSTCRASAGFFAGGCVVVESGWLGGGVSDTLLGPEGSRE